MQFLQALLGSTSPPSFPGLPAAEPAPGGQGMPSLGAENTFASIGNNDPFAAMGGNNPFAAILQQASAQGVGGAGMGKAPEVAKEKTRFQKLFLPLFHFGSMWALLAYFVVYLEPNVYEQSRPAGSHEAIWSRWAQSSRGPWIELVVSTAIASRIHLIFVVIAAIFLGIHHCSDRSTFITHIFGFRRSSSDKCTVDTSA